MTENHVSSLETDILMFFAQRPRYGIVTTIYLWRRWCAGTDGLETVMKI